uniref:Uncharacterized protein n=1 Tax=Arundo donax TaxID=35708 RepID=A0A0A9B3L0_ARUDO
MSSSGRRAPVPPLGSQRRCRRRCGRDRARDPKSYPRQMSRRRCRPQACLS